MRSKKITFNNYEIDAIVRNLDDPDSILATDDPERRLPISVLWVMETNLDKMRTIAQKILREREKIEASFSDDEHSEIYEADGQSGRKVKDKYIAEFQKLLSELMEIQNEIEIGLVDITALEKFSMTPRDFRSIKFMLTEGIENVSENAEVV